MFQAPPKPGKYCWSLLIVSDSYLGVDQKVSVLTECVVADKMCVPMLCTGGRQFCGAS